MEERVSRKRSLETSNGLNTDSNDDIQFLKSNKANKVKGMQIDNFAKSFKF